MSSEIGPLREVVRDAVAGHGTISEDVSDMLVSLGTALVQQLVCDLSNDAERVVPSTVFGAIRDNNMYNLAEKAEQAHTEFIRARKRANMDKLKEAGYGATTDHVSLMKLVFESLVREREEGK